MPPPVPQKKLNKEEMQQTVELNLIKGLIRTNRKEFAISSLETYIKKWYGTEICKEAEELLKGLK